MGDKTVNVGVATIIRASRLRTGLSARQLSAMAGLSPSYVGKIEAGQIDPSLRAFSKIATILKMSTQEIAFCVSLAGR